MSATRLILKFVHEEQKLGVLREEAEQIHSFIYLFW